MSDQRFEVTYDEVASGYRRQCERSRQITREAQLDDVAGFPFMKPTLRWVLVHMIEETARHNGQADVIRELTDGAAGE